MSYDSRFDTIKHVAVVRTRIQQVITALNKRTRLHDESKLKPPEKEIFDEMTPLLKDCTYGSEEYQGFLARMKPALDHHYENNRHHPEHYICGVRSMTLIDLLEMLADWKAAGERHADGSMFKSLQHNRTRFDIPEELFRILCSTAEDLKWIDHDEYQRLVDEAFKADNP